MYSKHVKSALLLFFLLAGLSPARCSDSCPDSLRTNRLLGVTAGGVAVYGAAMTGLYQLWYKDFDRTSFRFFDDSRDWLQMDKAGHVYSAYFFGDVTCASLRWSGLDRKKAAVYAGAAGFLSVSTIEFFDAHFKGWGFSWGDIVANAAGSALFTAQELTWKEQRIRMKFSFRSTSFPRYRPGTLGSNLPREVIKDYNGQSYWLSANINSFIPNSPLPDWLNIAAGYSGTGMLGGSENPEYHNGTPLPHFNRERQFYLSPDIDFSKIPTRSKALKAVFKALNIIKIPAPAMRFQNGTVRFFGIYY